VIDPSSGKVRERAIGKEKSLPLPSPCTVSSPFSFPQNLVE